MPASETSEKEGLFSLTILEAKELSDILEGKGITPAAAAVAVAKATLGITDANALDPSEEEFDIILVSAGDNKIAVIKEVRVITSLGLMESKDLVESGGVLLEDVRDDEADEIRRRLEAVGARVEFRGPRTATRATSTIDEQFAKKSMLSDDENAPEAEMAEVLLRAAIEITRRRIGDVGNHLKYVQNRSIRNSNEHL